MIIQKKYKSIIVIVVLFYLNTISSAFSNYDLEGTWVYTGKWSSTPHNYWVLGEQNSDGTGEILEKMGNNNPSPLGYYNYYDETEKRFIITDIVCGEILNNEYKTILTFYSENVVSVSQVGYGFSNGIFSRVLDTSSLQGWWVGTFTDSQESVSYNVQFQVDSDGKIIKGSMTNGTYEQIAYKIVSGNFFSPSNNIYTLNENKTGIAFIKTDSFVNCNCNTSCESTEDPYGQFSLSGSVVENKFFGASYDKPSLLTRQPETHQIWYRDSDNDGYGDPDYSLSFYESGYVWDNSDCNDNNSTIHPNAIEIRGDGIDQNCTGRDLPDFTDAAYIDVQNFVNRFYVEVLGRPGEAAGLEFWIDSLCESERAGSDVARGFIFSQEFINRGVSSGQFLTILYAAFFNRDPDIGGYNSWLGKMSNGTSQSDILDGFLYSPEFSNLCTAYGILPVK